MEKILGYKYNKNVFKSVVIADVDDKKCVLSTNFKKGDAVVRFVDKPANSYWMHGVASSVYNDGSCLIYKDDVPCGNAYTEIWYKIIAILS
jgi:selenophosphate synthetase-related protein